ncbi:unnamed protein product [Chrysoparadoxa australica]
MGRFLLFLAVALIAATANAFVPASSFTPSLAVKSQPSASSTTVMRTRVCDLLGKRANRKARVVTFSHTRNHKVQEVNLQRKRIFSPKLNRIVRLRLSTKGIKTIDKYGIDAAAKKFEVDLSKF